MNPLCKTIFYACVFASCVLLWGCAHSVKVQTSSNYQSLNYDEKVHMFRIEDRLPEQYEVLGRIKLEDTGLFSVDCSYEEALEAVELEARKVGANAVKILKHEPPNAWGNRAHRIAAMLIRVDQENIHLIDEVKDQKEIPEADYALLYLYRPNVYQGWMISYDIKLDGNLLFRAFNNSKKIIKIKKEGLQTLSAITESEVEFPLDIRFGKIYYIKSSVDMGVFVGRPMLEQVSAGTGKKEFQSIRWKKWDMRDVITLKNGEEIECIVTGSDDELLYYTILEDGYRVKMEIEKEFVKSIERNTE